MGHVWRRRGKGQLVNNWDRMRAWLDTLSSSRVHTMTRASAWAVRGVLWRKRVSMRVENVRESFARIEPALRIPFFSLAAILPTVHEVSNLEQYEFTPGVGSKARIIANPASGSSTDGTLKELADTAAWLTEQGLPTELRLTRRPGHATDLAREAAAAGYEVVIAAGGDGTVNDVIQALAGYRSALGVLPMGTVNVWAREMGIGLTTEEAREVILHGVRRRVDMGRAGQRYFLMMAGIGFDAEAARRVEHGKLKRFGLKFIEYLATVGIMSVTHQSDTLRFTVGGRKRSEEALMVIVGNTRLYGGAMTFTQRAVADDGVLDIVVIGSGGLFHRLSVIGRALLRQPTAGPHVRYVRAQRVRIESRRPVPVQVDGEVIGSLPMTFSIAPQALSVIVPRETPAGLFTRAPESSRNH